MCYGGWQVGQANFNSKLNVMKISLRLLAAVIGFIGLSLFNLHGENTPSEDSEFIEARKLYWAGKYQEAEAMFQSYLATNPNHGPTKNFLKMIAQSQRLDKGKVEQTRKYLETIRLEHVQFKEADWKAVTSFFQERANSKTDGKTIKESVSFINILPAGFSTTITLDLKDVSLMRAIEYACQQANLRYMVKAWAVTFEQPDSKK